LRRALRIAVATLLVLAVVGNAALMAAIVITREPAPRPLTATRIEAASRPAIVLVQSNYHVSFTVPAFVITDATEKSIEKQLLPRINSGEITTNATYRQAANQLILANPDAYYSVGAPMPDSFDMISTGSGFFVTEDGYLLTAAHVVSADPVDIRTQVIKETKDARYAGVMRDIIKRDWADVSISDPQVNTLVDFALRWVERYLAVAKVDVKYYLGSGSVEAGDRLVGTGARASVVSIDPTSTGRDIAIMKAEVSGVHALQLAAGQPRLGQVTHAIGYPRQGYLQEAVPSNQVVPPAMTSGLVLRDRQQKTGWTAWGTDATFTHGDSGGPVLDAQGNVLGLVSFAVVDDQGQQLPGQGYFVPSDYIREDLAKASVKTVAGPKSLTGTYYQALAEGDAQRYRTELRMLQQIQSRTSFDAYIGGDISSTQSQILGGNDRTPPELNQYVPAAAASSWGLVLLAFGVWMAVGVRRGKAVAAAAEVEAQHTSPPVPPSTNGESSSAVVSTPHEVLRASRPIVPIAPPAWAPPEPQEGGTAPGETPAS
jgi:serine protease Do